MKDETFLSLSFAATILYGLLALGGLLFACLWVGATTGAVCALLAIGSAYLSQDFATAGLAVSALRKPAVALQFLSCGLFLAGLYFFWSL